MLGYFRRLEERASALGNHRRKYLHGIDRHGRLLIDRLETTGRFDRVRLSQAAPNVGAEMDAVLEAGRDEREKLALLGCYHAIQLLNVNIRSIDFLRSEAPRTEDPLAVYKQFLHRVRDDFCTLTREYLGRILGLFLAGAPAPEFVVCIVGTRLHQDDVDMGIIDGGGAGRDRLNRAIGRMAGEMVRWTSAPDFYLSEHVGDSGYSASVDEYLQRLDDRILDFVSVSEILSAYPIVGSLSLFERFRAEMHRRYYHSPESAHREHEGYLRGLLSEIEALILWPKNPKEINPKDDLLRLVNAILWAFRTAEDVTELDAWDACDRLGHPSRERRELFGALEHHYTFVETFRHLYQQFSAQKESIDLTDPNEQGSLEQVAVAMGYEDIGVIGAWQQLLVRYFEHTRAGRKIVSRLVPHVRNHIKRVTLFNGWTSLLRSPAAPGGRRPSLDFLDRVRYFQGVKYWHDILDDLQTEENGLLGALFADLDSLGDERLAEISARYADWGHETFFTMLRVLTIFGLHAKKHRAERVFRAFDKAFRESIRGTADEIRRFSTVFMYYPKLVYRYLSLSDEGTARFLHDKLSGRVWDSEVAAWQKRLLEFLEIVLRSSRFFRRVTDRICERHPECFIEFGHLDELERIARGILAVAARHPSHETQRLELGDFYDVETLRIGIGTLRGLDLNQLDAEFTDVSDQYIRILFDTCKSELDGEIGRKIFTHDRLGIFVAGGHGRERAHQDDYDLIVLLNSDSEEIFQYSGRILNRLNREIVKRGIIPQYRLGDIFGGYVTRFSDLERHLRDSLEGAFVEVSQLLGARMIVGSSRLEGEFRERIIQGCIQSRKAVYFRAAAEEVAERRSEKARLREAMYYDVKESEGALRDIETAMLILKVRHSVEGPVGSTFLRAIAERLPEQRATLDELRESYEFLNRLRDVYRLTVCPSNFIHPAHFEQPAQVLGYAARGSRSAGEELRADFRRHCTRSAKILDAIVASALASS